MAIAPNANLGDDFYALQNLPWNYGTGQWHRDFNEQYGAASLPRYLAALGLSQEQIASRVPGYGQPKVDRVAQGQPGRLPQGYSGPANSQVRVNATGSGTPGAAHLLGNQLGYPSAVPGDAPRRTLPAMQARYNLLQQMFGLQQDELAAQGQLGRMQNEVTRTETDLARIRQDQARQAALDQLRIIEQGNAVNFNWGPYQALQMLLSRR